MNSRDTKLHRTDPASPLPGEGSVLEEVARIFDNPNEWLMQEHPLLGGRSPQDCIDADDGQAVRDLLRGIVFVGQS
ncbi:MAG: antitoxin Xre/MbcA/ParS toxin-binding domain-containing protein [Rhizomicrobium sp.]